MQSQPGDFYDHANMRTHYVTIVLRKGLRLKLFESIPVFLGVFAPTDPGFLSYQEDRFTIASIHMDPATIQRTIDKVPPEFQRQWDPQAVGDEFASQMLFVGVYDGSVNSTY